MFRIYLILRPGLLAAMVSVLLTTPVLAEDDHDSALPPVVEVPTPEQAAAIIEAEMSERATRAAARRADLLSVPALEEWEAGQARNGRVHMRRIPAPPRLPKPTVQPAAAEESDGANLDLSTHPAFGGKIQHRSLALAATVHDGPVSEITWRDRDGQEWIAWSPVHFGHLSQLASFRDGDIYWSMFILASESDQPGPEIPQSPDEGPAYFVLASDDEEVPTLLLEALDMLHRYHAAHAENLAAAYERRKALNKARREWHEQNPPAPEETIINFWRNR